MNIKQNGASVDNSTMAMPQQAIPQTNTDSQPIKSLYFGDASTSEGKHTVTVFSEFGALMTNPQAVNELRQDLRAWFMAYIPVWETSFSQNNLDESIRHYEALDNFLSSLIQEGICQLKGGEAR